MKERGIKMIDSAFGRTLKLASKDSKKRNKKEKFLVGKNEIRYKIKRI